MGRTLKCFSREIFILVEPLPHRAAPGTLKAAAATVIVGVFEIVAAYFVVVVVVLMIFVEDSLKKNAYFTSEREWWSRSFPHYNLQEIDVFHPLCVGTSFCALGAKVRPALLRDRGEFSGVQLPR